MKRKKVLFKKQANKLPIMETTKYQEIFLSHSKYNDLKKCAPSYISQDVYQKIKCIVDILGEGNITTGEYIGNVLKHHLEGHKKEINTIYRNRQKDLI